MGKKTTQNKDVVISINPATLEVIGETKTATKEEVILAIKKAEQAFSMWSSLSLEDRAKHLLSARDYMLDRIDEVCKIISEDNGKPRVEALSAEVFLVADLITYYANRAKDVLADKPIPLHNPLIRTIKSSRLVYQPLGVVTVVSPWNYPFSIPMSGICFALLAGNTVVFKPSSEVTMVGLKIDEILRKGGGLPDGVLNTIIASGSAVGESIFSPPVRKVVFTGSTEIGAKIQAICAKHLIPTVMELGGKDPMIVLEDADLELAVSGAVWGAFMNCGQVCSSVERVYVAKNIYNKFLEMAVEKTKALRVGQDLNHEIDIGPMINEEQLQIVDDQVKDALQKGARLLTGGERLKHLIGYFYAPTVLADCNHTMKVMKEETFGPVMPVMPFETEDEAISLANDSIYGLTASIWTRDRTKADFLAKRIEAGTVTINDHAYTYGLCETPWQGMKESGIGRSHSDEGLLEFVFPKHIHSDHSLRFMKRRLWWFPYSQHLYEMQKLFVKAFINMKDVPKLLFEVARKGEFRKMLF